MRYITVEGLDKQFIVRKKREKGVLREEDLWTTEEKVIRKILADGELRAAWEAFPSLSRTERAQQPDSRPGWRQIPAKKRWIDPLVAGSGRVSSLDAAFAASLAAFLNEPQTEWVLGW